jgi:hypothetical protein
MPIRAASSDRLDQRRASFETAAARAPQDEHVSQCHQTAYLTLGHALRASLERTISMQPFVSLLPTIPSLALSAEMTRLAFGHPSPIGFVAWSSQRAVSWSTIGVKVSRTLW